MIKSKKQSFIVISIFTLILFLGVIAYAWLYYGIRPSISLKSGIKITGGTGYVGGDTNSPFEISE